MAKFNFSKYNRAGQEYKSLRGLFEEQGDLICPIRSIYINTKSKFGDAPVIVSDGFNINLPKHMTATVTEMISDPEAMALIRAGKVGIKPILERNSTGLLLRRFDFKDRGLLVN